jgi:hypothetical protein
MKLRLIATVVLFLLGFTLRVDAQSAAQKATDPPKEREMPVEKVDGFWSVMGYFGSKLTDELGERLNLSDKKKSDGVPTRVDIKLGSFEISRTENRKPG